MVKKFFELGHPIVQLVPHTGGFMATDRIMVDGQKVGYMYRSEPGHAADTGWCFFSGDESDQYANDVNKLGFYAVNTIANFDPDVIPYLDTESPCAFEKIPGTFEFVRVEDPPTE